ncbi:MAG: hypothetical protein B6241_00400 [Spirochaetaceae bacterium 4572_59]|nr:MAG: hypothetical protein B6241_00400 [Spirochaetaceae bacterium 4572_59]
MARAKKTDAYKYVYENLSYEDKVILRTELEYAIKADERDFAKLNQKENARKVRDKLKIHDKIKYLFKKEELLGEIIAITVDKVQVISGETKRSVSYNKIIL